jgi:hypothetical protein
MSTERGVSMKHLVVLIAAGLVALAIYAVAAPAGEQKVTPKQLAALSKRVTNLQKELRGFESCLTQAVPVNLFGDAQNGAFGYIYRDSTGEFLTTALDVTDAAHAAGYALLTDAQCAAIINSGKKKVAHFRPHALR